MKLKGLIVLVLPILLLIGCNRGTTSDEVIQTSISDNGVSQNSGFYEVDVNLPSESIDIGGNTIEVRAKDAKSKIEVLNDVIMLLDVTNNSTVYYQDTGLKLDEDVTVCENYLISWACNSGDAVLGDVISDNSMKDLNFDDINITSMSLDGRDIRFYYRFSDNGYADVYLLQNNGANTYAGIHIFGLGDDLDDVVALISYYLL